MRLRARETKAVQTAANALPLVRPRGVARISTIAISGCGGVCQRRYIT